MKSIKFKAYKLRISGRSYNEINKLLRIPKSTLSTWFSRLELPEEAKIKIADRVYQRSVSALIKRNLAQTRLAEKRARSTRNSATKEILNLSKRDLFILGITLYWAEGYKRPVSRNGRIRTYHKVSLTNSDPKIIYLFLEFLRKICKVPEEKIRGHIRMFEHQNESYLASFWQNLTNIPSVQFQKTYQGVSISSQRKRPFNALPYGVIQIIVGDTNLYHKIMGWIDGLGAAKIENH